MEIFNKYGALTFDSPLYNEVAVVEDAILLEAENPTP
jgi:hypothetical protein